MKNLNFALIRIECCNQYKDTPCRIALVGVDGTQIVDKREFLIDPEEGVFDFMASGTQLSDLRGKGNFAEHWADIVSFIHKYSILVSTADGYDSDVLFNAIRKFHVNSESIPYMTAKNILRRSISTYSFAFDHMCKLLGVECVDNMPMTIATSWCELIITACKEKEEDCLLDFAENNKLVVGSISSEDYIKCAIRRIYKPYSNDDKVLDESKFQKDHLFYGQNVVFTGNFQYFTKDDAKSFVETIGGIPTKGLSKKTNYLVAGEQKVSQVGPGGLSEKQRKAIKYKEEGIDIELLNEVDFIEIMGLQDIVAWKTYINETF